MEREVLEQEGQGQQSCHDCNCYCYRVLRPSTMWMFG